MKFSSEEEFELHVHKCFGKIFELLSKMDQVVKPEAEKEEEQGNPGMMTDLRDWVEEAVLHCHLAWQYHRLSKGSNRPNTWPRVTNRDDGEELQ